MFRPSMMMILACAGLGFACGDDGAGDGGTGSSSGDSTAAQETGTTASTNDPSTSSGPMTSSSSGSSGTAADSTGTSTGGETDAETDTAGIDCSMIPAGPLAVEVVFEPNAVFNGTEDISFDGQGNLAGKNAGEVLLVDPAGAIVDSWADGGPAYGLRFAGNGDLLIAKFSFGEIRVVNGGGGALVTGVGGVNGLWPDFDDNVWFTNGSAVRRVNPDASIDDIVTGASAASSNGVLLDPARGLLFYTNYGPGLVRSVVINPDGSPGAISMVASIPGAALDGLNLDACGNLYVMDQGNSALYRVFLDEAGAAVGEPEVLVQQFPLNVANAVFGSGPGWDPMSLYAAGFPGGIYRVEVGVPGTPYPTP